MALLDPRSTPDVDRHKHALCCDWVPGDGAHLVVARCQIPIVFVAAIASLAKLSQLCREYGINDVYLATDSQDPSDIARVEALIYGGANGPVIVHTFPQTLTHTSLEDRVHLGSNPPFLRVPSKLVAMVEMWLCTEAAVFVGTWPSTFSALIVAQRVVHYAHRLETQNNSFWASSFHQADAPATFFWGVD